MKCKCGEDISKPKKHCPECGEKLPDDIKKSSELEELLVELAAFAQEAAKLPAQASDEKEVVKGESQGESPKASSGEAGEDEEENLEIAEALLKANNILSERTDEIGSEARAVHKAVGKIADVLCRVHGEVNSLKAELAEAKKVIDGFASQPGRARSALVTPLTKGLVGGEEKKSNGPSGDDLVKAAVEWELKGMLKRSDATLVDYWNQRGKRSIEDIGQVDRALAGRLVQAASRNSSIN